MRIMLNARKHLHLSVLCSSAAMCGQHFVDQNIHYRACLASTREVDIHRDSYITKHNIKNFVNKCLKTVEINKSH